MNAIVIKIPADRNLRDRVNLTGVVRINEEAELALLSLCGRTGLSMRSIASQLITQAAAVCTVEEVSLYE